jgi:hypothetical protein
MSAQEPSDLLADGTCVGAVIETDDDARVLIGIFGKLVDQTPRRER